MRNTVADDRSGVYNSVYARGEMRKRSYRVLVFCLAIAFIWLAAIVSPPVLASLGSHPAAAGVFSFFGWMCHQIPERSFHFAGEQLGVCSRCFGVYFGLLVGFAVYPLWRNIENIEPLPRLWLFASIVPLGIDFALTLFGIWENTHFSRFVTGLILGAACATYIIPAAVEIAQNFAHARARRA